MTKAVDSARRRLITLRRAPVPLTVRPPWTHEASVRDACSGCGACVSACPENIILLDGQGYPALDFRKAECTFCGRCADACAESVFVCRDEAPFSHGVTIGSACLAIRGIACESCADLCPESAISFRFRIGGPPVPSVADSRCSGCGACIAGCPASAILPEPRAAVVHPEVRND